jgi:hypothetical protein
MSDLFFERLESKVDMIVKSLDEAVNIKDISPAARSEVLKQKELHRRSNVKKDKVDSPELHMMSPMKKRDRDILEKKIEKDFESKDRVLMYSAKGEDSDDVVGGGSQTVTKSTFDNKLNAKDDDETIADTSTGINKKHTVGNIPLSSSSIHPDKIWAASRLENKSDIITFLYIGSSSELFYVNKFEKYNDDPYNVLNYMVSNPNNPIKNLSSEQRAMIKDIPENLRLTAFRRTHYGLLKSLLALFHSSDFRYNFKTTYSDLAKSFDSVSKINNFVLLGRGGKIKGEEVVSFWNHISEALATKVVSNLEKRTGEKYSKIYVSDRNIIRT